MFIIQILLNFENIWSIERIVYASSVVVGGFVARICGGTTSLGTGLLLRCNVSLLLFLTSVVRVVLDFLRLVDRRQIERRSVFVALRVVTIGVEEAAVVKVALVVDGLVEVVIDEVELRGFLADVVFIGRHADQMHLMKRGSFGTQPGMHDTISTVVEDFAV